MSVIIVGGGITGITLALAISHFTENKLPVTIIEAINLKDCSHSDYNGRTIALAEGTCKKLAEIGLWSILADCVTPITHVQVSDRGYASFVDIDAADYDISALGNVIELQEMSNRLYYLLLQKKGIRLYCPQIVKQVEYRHDKIIVTMESGIKLDSQLLVAADGSHSNIATRFNIQRFEEDYQQIAVITNVTTQIANYGRAYERFTQNGPLALLPISNNRSSLVWCQKLKEKINIQRWNDQIFLKNLQQVFGWRLGRFTHVEKRYYHRLMLQKSCQIVANRLALVGNAAQTLHPIAGQGFNLGMRDVMSLAETLADAYLDRKDIGSFSVLWNYEERRIVDRNITIKITDGLVRLFSNRFLPLVIGRNIGLMIIDSFPQLRNFLVKRKLGWIIN